MITLGLVRARALVLFLAVCAGFTALVVWVLELSLERALLLAPAFVISAGAIAGIAVLWTRAALDVLRKRRAG